MSPGKAKSARRHEAEKATKVLDVHNILFLDLGNHPFDLDREATFKLVNIVRSVQPDSMMSHAKYDP